MYVGQTIWLLAILMAGKARLLENTLYQALTSDEDSNANTELCEQFNTFKTVLIHDLTTSDFADIYAQTLVYGMLIVATAFHPSLAPVGVFLGILGYAMGTVGGYISTQLMRLVVS